MCTSQEQPDENAQVCDQVQISPTLFYQWYRIADRAAMTALQGQACGRKNLRPSEEALLTYEITYCSQDC